MNDAYDRIPLKEVFDYLKIPYQKNRKGYRWKQHPSFWFDQNFWYWHSQGKHGHTYDFVVDVLGYSDDNAKNLLQSFPASIPEYLEPENTVDHPLSLPKPNTNNEKVIGYLTKVRHLDPELLNRFISGGLVYESEKYHDCVFVGKDEETGRALHANLRSSFDGENCVKRNVPFSKGAWSFHYIGSGNKLYIFEAPIDLMSYLTLHPYAWEKNSYLALCGVSSLALNNQLKLYPRLNEVILCLDNDDPGKMADERITKELCHNSQVKDIQVIRPNLKDFNDDLKLKCGESIRINRSPQLNQEVFHDLEAWLKVIKYPEVKDLQFFQCQLLQDNGYGFPSYNKVSLGTFCHLAAIALALAKKRYHNLSVIKANDELIEDLKQYPSHTNIDPEQIYKELISQYREILKLENPSMHSFSNPDLRYLVIKYLNFARYCVDCETFLLAALSERPERKNTYENVYNLEQPKP